MKLTTLKEVRKVEQYDGWRKKGAKQETLQLQCIKGVNVWSLDAEAYCLAATDMAQLFRSERIMLAGVETSHVGYKL